MPTLMSHTTTTAEATKKLENWKFTSVDGTLAMTKPIPNLARHYDNVEIVRVHRLTSIATRTSTSTSIAATTTTTTPPIKKARLNPYTTKSPSTPLWSPPRNDLESEHAKSSDEDSLKMSVHFGTDLSSSDSEEEEANTSTTTNTKNGNDGSNKNDGDLKRLFRIKKVDANTFDFYVNESLIQTLFGK